jgi:hypothetical protein
VHHGAGGIESSAAPAFLIDRSEIIAMSKISESIAGGRLVPLFSALEFQAAPSPASLPLASPHKAIELAASTQLAMTTASTGNTAPHGAVERRADTIVQLLGDHGANLNANDWRGWTPLVIAEGVSGGFFNRYPRTAELLLKLSAEPSARDIERGGGARRAALPRSHEFWSSGGMCT